MYHISPLLPIHKLWWVLQQSEVPFCIPYMYLLASAINLEYSSPEYHSYQMSSLPGTIQLASMETVEHTRAQVGQQKQRRSRIWREGSDKEMEENMELSK